jgi:hypothetical protein
LGGLVELELEAVGDITCSVFGIFEDTILESQDQNALAVARSLEEGLVISVAWSWLCLTSLISRFDLPGVKMVTSNFPSYDVVHPLGGPSLGAISSVTA